MRLPLNFQGKFIKKMLRRVKHPQNENQSLEGRFIDTPPGGAALGAVTLLMVPQVNVSTGRPVVRP